MGARRDGARDPQPSGTGDAQPAKPGGGAGDRRAVDARGRRPPRRGRRRPLRRGRAGAAARLAGRDGAGDRRGDAAADAAGRRAEPRGSAPARPADPRARGWARPSATWSAPLEDGRLDMLRHSRELFDACLPAIPYAASAAFLGREKLKLTRSTAIVRGWRSSPTGSSSVHGVSHTISQIRERGVPGYEVEVIGTDADVDRRLSAVAEIEVPFYKGLQIGVPGLPAIVEALVGRPLRRHPPVLARSGRARRLAAGAGAGAAGRRQLPHRAGPVRRGCARAPSSSQAMVAAAVGAFYGSCDVVLSPSPATDAGLRRARDRRAPDRALGPRRRPHAVRSGDADRGAVRRARSTCCTPDG